MCYRLGNFEFRKSKSLLGEFYYEIVRYVKNDLYGKEYSFSKKLREDGSVDYYFEALSGTGLISFRMDPSCFKHPESCYTVLFFREDKEDGFWIESVGDRVVSSVDSNQDTLDLHQLISYGFKQLRLERDERED